MKPRCSRILICQFFLFSLPVAAFPFLVPQPFRLPFARCALARFALNFDIPAMGFFLTMPCLMSSRMSALVMASFISLSFSASKMTLSFEQPSNAAAIRFCDLSIISVPLGQEPVLLELLLRLSLIITYFFVNSFRLFRLCLFHSFFLFLLILFFLIL